MFKTRINRLLFSVEVYFQSIKGIDHLLDNSNVAQVQQLKTKKENKDFK